MASTRPLIGLIGKKRSGKDTFAAALVEEGWARVAFADPLKSAAYDLDPLVGEVFFRHPDEPAARVHREARLSDVVESLGWEKAKDLVPEARRTLQRLGVAIRGLDPDFWLRQGVQSIAQADGPVVVTDVRFPNEADAIRALGGSLVRVVRPETEVPDPHPSETALDDYPVDAIFHNTSTIEALQVFARSYSRLLT